MKIIAQFICFSRCRLLPAAPELLPANQTSEAEGRPNDAAHHSDWKKRPRRNREQPLRGNDKILQVGPRVKLQKQSVLISSIPHPIESVGDGSPHFFKTTFPRNPRFSPSASRTHTLTRKAPAGDETDYRF